MSSVPIADYGLLSDCHSAALVSRAGSVDWLCFPRFDGPSVFGRLLGDDAGHWSIAPVGESKAVRRYVDRTMVLETTFSTPSGTARLVETMALNPTEHGHDLGVNAPGVLVRTLEGLGGEVPFEMEFAPRPEYGLIEPLLVEGDEGVSLRGGAHVLALTSPLHPDIDGPTARLTFSVRQGEAVTFAMHHRTTWEEPPSFWSQKDAQSLVVSTIEAWQKWSSVHQAYEGPWSDLVYQSGRVLQSLMFQPTGAIVAAPTTSLPEGVGGERNWDYRFAWVRDASFTLHALWVAACPDEADTFFSWLTGTVASQRADEELQIMFGVGGEHDLSEREIAHLPGWRGSRPVRVGNGAWNQRQLDVYGELLDAAARLSEQLTEMDEPTKRFLARMADAASERWREQDQGIWEVRGAPRDFLYSKLMCWVALDRAIQIASLIGAEDRVEDWTAKRDEIREAILTKGWSESANAFTQSFGSDDLDASSLMMPIVGFLPADDPRVRATVDAIGERLTDERGLVFRYRPEEGVDGLEGTEGTFLLCTFWLAEALALAGELDRARDTFERAVSFSNDLGLLSEEVDESTGELLGNFPQAFSHIGLVNAAWTISQRSDAA